MFNNPYQNYRDGFLNRLFNFLLGRNVLSRLVLINTIIILAVALAQVYFYLFNLESRYPEGVNPLVYYLSMPADLNILVQRPWAVITSMFVHQDFFHFLFNMIMLYFSGLIFTSFLKPNKLLFSYLFGGITGVVFYAVAYNVFPVFEPVIAQSIAFGASAAVMSVLFSAVAYTPDFSIRLFFLGEIKLKYLAIIFVLIDLLSLTGGNAGGHIAHLGGAVFGLAFGFFLRKRFSFRIKTPFRKKRKPKMKVNKGRPLTDEEYLRQRAEKNKKIDEILDKISKGGYESLSKEEKDFLFKYSK